MLGQNENAGFKRMNAKPGCRSCLIDDSHRGDLEYDIIEKGHYHHHVAQLREYGNSLAAGQYKKFCATWGFAENPTKLLELTPCLNIITSRPADPAHSEWNSLAKRSLDLFLTSILTTGGKKEFAAQLKTFVFPSHWPRLQAPHHLGSYTMQELGRLLVITPMVIRYWMKPQHMKPEYLNAARSFSHLSSN